MNFNEWLSIREAILRAAIRMLNEVQSFDPDLRAAKTQINRALEDITGQPLDYFGICLIAARRYVRGQDTIELATQLANTIMSELNDPQSRLSQDFARASGNPNHIEAIFRTAVQLRARRDSDFYTQRRRSTNTMNVSSIADPGKEGGEEGIYGKAPKEVPDSRLEDLKRYVEEELQKMLDEAPARSKRSLAKAILVARERMRYAPDMVPMAELLKIFDGEGDMPKISKGSMSAMLKIIEDAVKRVAERFDDETLRQGATSKWGSKVGG
jgi:hypothetical protein